MFVLLEIERIEMDPPRVCTSLVRRPTAADN
jgi:hypothetical protein